MEINELYKRLREEGRSTGHAQWIIGNYYLTGRNVEKDPDKAEEWFLKRPGCEPFFLRLKYLPMNGMAPS